MELYEIEYITPELDSTIIHDVVHVRNTFDRMKLEKSTVDRSLYMKRLYLFRKRLLVKSCAEPYRWV